MLKSCARCLLAVATNGAMSISVKIVSLASLFLTSGNITLIFLYKYKNFYFSLLTKKLNIDEHKSFARCDFGSFQAFRFCS